MIIYTVMSERDDTNARMRHLKDHIVVDYESSEVAVVAVVLITARGAINTGFGLDEWITARSLAASHGGTSRRPLIIRVAVVQRRRHVAERVLSNGRIVLLVG